MSYNTLLGICIPTYKRPDQLRQCVRSIIAAAAPHRVPIFIADDSADDTNTAAVAELQAEYPYLVCERNARNLGIDGNIVHSVDICGCDYAWLIGEDDRMLPEAITTILPILARETPAFVAANYSYVNETISLVLREKQMLLTADRIEDSGVFFQNDAWAIGFIGSCIINKSRWQAVDPAPYIGTYFAHVGVILESIAGLSVHLVAQPLVLNRVGGAEVFTWSGDAFGVFGGWSKVVHLLEPLYGAAACDASAASFERGHGLNTVRFLMAKRADRLYTPAVYRQVVRLSDRSRPYKWAALGIALSPPFVFRVFRAVLSFARQRRNRKVEMHL